jgi:nucleotide-binding universal stress UspA family protein
MSQDKTPLGEQQLSPLARFERLLVATDGSEYSEGAVKVAIAMAAKGGVPLTVLTAVIASPELDGLGSDGRGKMEADAAARLEKVENEASRQGVRCTKVIRYGDDPYREIVNEAKDSNADLVIVGRRGKRGLARLMLGDATVKVIGNAPCSVMVVPKAADMWRTRILLATDGSRSGDAAAVAATRIAHCCGNPVTVVSAQVPGHSDARQAEARQIVDRVVGHMKAQGLEADGLVNRGDAHTVIVSAANERAADLVIMGSHGRTGLGRLLLGSNSERVIGQVTCPVMVVKG